MRTDVWTQQQALRCMCALLSAVVLFSQHAEALYCVQCESTEHELCRIGLVPPTKCTVKGAMACVTMVGKYPGGNYVGRTCTKKPKGTYCRKLRGMPGMDYEICLRTCFTSGCNGNPEWSYRDFNVL